jgi:hypothetical protein
MTEQVAEKKSEVMKLGANMSETQRAELENFEKHVKENAGLTVNEEVLEEEEEKKVSTCQRCGHREGDTKPPEEDMQEYMRSVLGNRRFSKTYELMRGQVKVTFTTIDTAASERVNRIIERLSVLEDPVQFRAVATKINMAYMLTSYTMGGDTEGFEVSKAETPEDVTKDFINRFGSMDESILQLLTRALGTFITLKSALIDECFDESFYKGAGPF